MAFLRRIYLRSWRGLALTASLAIIAYILYFRRLGSLLPGYSLAELNTFHIASSWHHLTNNPINAPYLVPVWLLTTVAHRSILTTRIVAACFGLAAGLLFFAIVRTWCTYRAAYLTTVMFVTSAGLLHVARLGTGDVLQMSILALLACALWYRYRKARRPLIGYVIAALFVILLYVPGMFWFEVLGLALLWSTVLGQLRRSSKVYLTGLTALMLVLLAPLAYASLHQPKILLQAAGLPQGYASMPHIGSTLLQTVLGIIIRSNGSPLYWVGHAPLLSAIEVILGILGVYFLYREAPRRGLFLFGSAVIGLVLVSLGGPVVLACLVPILYLFIATGLDQLLGLWLRVFPRNPVARYTGVGVVCIMLLFSVLYQVRAYYIAWPHNVATRQAFHHQAP